MGEGQGPRRLQDFEDPLGVHLYPHVRERILDGFYIDFFTLLKLESESGKTGAKRDKRGQQRGVPDVILITGFQPTQSI